jgi:ATP-dependent protease ClpP protease subunit
MSRYIVLGIALVLVIGLPITLAIINNNSGLVTQEEVLIPFSVPNTKSKENLSVKAAPEQLQVVRLGIDLDQIAVLAGSVNPRSVALTLARLEQIRMRGYREALLVIDSPGGSVFAGAELIAYINSSPMVINTYCKLLCASMGAHILQAGKTRYSGEKAIIMFHPASGGLKGTLEEMSSLLKTINKYVDRFDQHAVSRSKMEYVKFKQLSRDELWLDGPDAFKLGFVDRLALVVPTKGALEDAVPVEFKDSRTNNGRIDSLRTFN